MYMITENTINRINKVLQSKEYFRYKGPNKLGECDIFENQFSKYLNPTGTQHSLLLSSGTNALIAALKALNIGPGDEVIIPVNTFVATALAVLNVGAIPILANSDSTLTISLKDIRSKITDKTKAIIPVHLDGLACDMENICNLADEHNLFIIEDTAQAIGGEYKSKKLGTFGSFGCFSLNVDKIISSGEGGIVATDSLDLYKKAFIAHDPAAQFGPTNIEFLKDITQTSFASMRVSEIQGVMAQEQLDSLDPILQKLRENKRTLIKKLQQTFKDKLVIPRGHDEAGDCSTTLHITLNKPEDMIDLTKYLFDNGHNAMPLPTRLAHFGWQWKNILPYKFVVAYFLETVDISSRTIRIPIEYNWCLEDISKLDNHLTTKLKDLGY